ncbi:hypothetical protein FGB62_24g06 [Gracilaria domingensis]|nr:hypothetical protein FGB62_24g06 [Gracilaria domingensis]
MSTSPSTETPVLTAAEKAEIRRRKILAKKNARMEYAAGKRTALPSEAPSEPIDEVPPQAPTASANADPAQIRYEAERPVSDRLVAIDPTSYRGQRSYDGSGLQRPNVFSGAFSIFNARVMRLTVLTLLAMAYTAALTFDYIPRWQVSAVEVFFSAECIVGAKNSERVFNVHVCISVYMVPDRSLSTANVT